MINYTATIFLESGSNLTPTMSAIIIGGIQVIGIYLSTILVDKAGRKVTTIFFLKLGLHICICKCNHTQVLLAISSLGASFGYICLGVYTLLSSIIDVSGYEWIPVVTFSYIMFIISIGLIPIPSLVQTEILPQKIRAIGLTICVILTWILAFTMVKIFPFIMLSLGMHGSMFLFAGCSFAGAAYVLLVLPETKGKSFDEIVQLLS